MKNDIGQILVTEEQLKARVLEMSRQISADYAGENPLFVGILKGSFIFMADLVRQVEGDCGLDFMAVSSYGNQSETTGAVKINKDLSQDIEGRHVILVEDILDTGVTLSYLLQYLQGRGPASLEIAALLDKPERRKKPVQAKYIGFTIPDAFVVGYGLDFAERYRNLPYVGVLKPEAYC